MKYTNKNKLLQHLFLIFSIGLFILPVVTKAQKKEEQKFIWPAKEWIDHKGNAINAHGGGILFHNGIYYWYGEHKIEGKSEANFADGGIHCYSSTDLINWTDVGLVLSVDYTNKDADLAYGCLLERPKVVYNKNTKKFIAYFKFYPKGFGYEIAYVGVAVANSPVGPFTYSHKFLAAESTKGSGDFSMFLDDNGELYHLAVRKPDKTFVIGKMNSDYLLPHAGYTVCKGIEAHTEAPAVIKINGIYHMLSSASTGWKPNTARYYTSKNIAGPWEYHGNPCSGFNIVDSVGSDKTFGSQSSFVFQIAGMPNAYVGMFDIWRPDMPIQGRYIWLPLTINQNKISVNWIEKWNKETFNKK